MGSTDWTGAAATTGSDTLWSGMARSGDSCCEGRADASENEASGSGRLAVARDCTPATAGMGGGVCRGADGTTTVRRWRTTTGTGLRGTPAFGRAAEPWTDGWAACTGFATCPDSAGCLTAGRCMSGGGCATGGIPRASINLRIRSSSDSPCAAGLRCTGGLRITGGSGGELNSPESSLLFLIRKFAKAMTPNMMTTMSFSTGTPFCYFDSSRGRSAPAIEPRICVSDSMFFIRI